VEVLTGRTEWMWNGRSLETRQICQHSNALTCDYFARDEVIYWTYLRTSGFGLLSSRRGIEVRLITSRQTRVC